MNRHRSIAISLVSLRLVIPGLSQAQSKDQFGKVDFQNSCSPAVQDSFQRAVAMLHSFADTEKAFREVLAQDPSCAIATWGIAAILMSHPLAGVGPAPQWAERAKAAIEQGRKIGAKTQRERDYIEAVAAYYENSANRPERTRQINRAQLFFRPRPALSCYATPVAGLYLCSSSTPPGGAVHGLCGYYAARAALRGTAALHAELSFPPQRERYGHRDHRTHCGRTVGAMLRFIRSVHVEPSHV